MTAISANAVLLLFMFILFLNVLFEFYRVVMERLAFLLMGEFSELMGLGVYLLDTHAAAHLPLVGAGEHLPDVFSGLGAGPAQWQRVPSCRCRWCPLP